MVRMEKLKILRYFFLRCDAILVKITKCDYYGLSPPR